MFGSFPILFLFAQNADRMYPVELVKPLLFVAAAAVVLTAGLAVMLRSADKGAILTAVLMILFFSWGHMTGLLQGHSLDIGKWTSGPKEWAGAFSAAVFILILLLLVRTRRDLSKLTTLLCVVAAVLVSIQVVQAGARIFSRPAVDSPDVPGAAGTSSSVRTPNIYYIVMDGYGREDILNEMFEYDNGAFVQYLESRGFRVAGKGHSNYGVTVLSITSALNGNYIQDLIEVDRESRGIWPLRQLLENNLVFKTVKKYGYSIACFASGYGFTELKDVDLYIPPGVTISEFHNLLINSTPITLFLPDSLSLFDIHRRRIEFVIDGLPDVFQVKSPYFVFAHILAPHPPFVFNREGQPRERTWCSFNFDDGSRWIQSGGTREEYRLRYKDQITHITARLQKAVEKILSRSGDDPPVIIIQGDHGPGSRLVWKRDPAHSNLRERFSILNAYYLPGVDSSAIYDAITPVNSFRVVFNQYFDTPYELLPDRCYFSPVAYPYFMTDITGQLRP